jgi:chitin disaccharide deacetylase
MVSILVFGAPRMAGLRQLVVVADDFGIGPETDRGILDVAADGRITATVLLVNSPYAERAVANWNRAGRPVELGWHPALTLDRPILPPERVPSLVDSAGFFHPLSRFLRNSLLGHIHEAEVRAELAAQYERFVELVGEPPKLVNSHQHASLFRPVTAALRDVLLQSGTRPFVRRVCEPWVTLCRVPGARIKRLMLAQRGRRQAQQLERDGFPGCDWLAGITNPRDVAHPLFHRRWLAAMPGQTVELMCHPGHLDCSLIGRDAPAEDGNLWRRVYELDLFRRDDYFETVREAGFVLVPPSRIGTHSPRAVAA